MPAANSNKTGGEDAVVALMAAPQGGWMLGLNGLQARDSCYGWHSASALPVGGKGHPNREHPTAQRER